MLRQNLRVECLLIVAAFGHQAIAQIITKKETAVRSVISRFAEARNAHDGAAVAALYSQDGEWMQNQGTPLVRGRVELAKLWGRMTGRVDRTVSSVEFPGANIAVVRVATRYEEPIGQHSEVFVLVDNGHGWEIQIHQTLD